MKCIVQFTDGTSEGYYFDPETLFESDYLRFSSDKGAQRPVYVHKNVVLKVTTVTEKQFKEYIKLAEAHTHENHH